MTVAFEIKSPIKKKKCQFFPKGYRETLVTIWHVDPEKDGSDDSCGWFKRPKHGNQEHYDKIKKEFDYDFDKTSLSDDKKTTYFFGWFHPSGEPMYSPFAIALGLFWRAALIHFESDFGKAEKFMKKNLFSILHFAENPTDSMIDTIANKYNSKRDERVRSLAAMVYGCILRWSLPWYRHPRWHFWHWKIDVHPIAKFKRWAFSRCCKCGKGFSWGYASTTNSWHGTGPLWFRSEKDTYHSNCQIPSSECMAQVESK